MTPLGFMLFWILILAIALISLAIRGELSPAKRRQRKAAREAELRRAIRVFRRDSKLHVPCPNGSCNAAYSIAEDAVGRQMKCPKCKTDISIPPSDFFEELEGLAMAVAQLRRIRSLMLAVAGAGVCSIFMGAGIVFSVDSPRSLVSTIGLVIVLGGFVALLVAAALGLGFSMRKLISMRTKWTKWKERTNSLAIDKRMRELLALTVTNSWTYQYGLGQLVGTQIEERRPNTR